jgi:hypothetical protein
MAHAWIGYWSGGRTSRAEDVRWLTEGGATLLEYMRLPTETWGSAIDTSLFPTHQQDGYIAARAIASRSCSGLPSDLERDASDNGVAYEMGSYTLAELYYTYLGETHTDAQFWTAFAMLFYANPDEIGPGEVDAWITTTMGLTDFYGEWVVAGRVGTPLLALDWTAGTATDTADTGASGVVDIATVSQVQGDMYSMAHGCVDDAPVFTEVPYYLGCQLTADATVMPFAECGATESVLSATKPELLTSASAAITLTRSSSLGTSEPYPADVALLSNDALLPDVVPTAGGAGTGAGVRAWRWFLICAPGDTTCGADTDVDGYSAGSDCDDTDATVHLGASSGVPGAVDYNCDGWY